MQYHQKAHYPLRQVKELIRTVKWRVNDNARTEAKRCFGWNSNDIKKAFLALKPCHFTKSEPSKHKPGVTIDYYKANRLMGEDVYTHFYIDPTGGFLVINSFKRNENERSPI